MSNIRARRSFADLYAKGKEVRFSRSGSAVYNHSRDKTTGTVIRLLETVYDLEGEEVELPAPGSPDPVPWTDTEPSESPEDGVDGDILVWVRPPNAQEREQALRNSQTERSKAILRARNEQESAENVTTDSFVGDMDNETLLDYIVMSDDQNRREEAQRKVLLKDEWRSPKGDNKEEDKTKIGFSELQELMRKWDEAGNPDTEEWQPLIDRDIEFGTQVDEEMETLRDISRESLKLLPRSDLEERGRRRRIALLGDQAFMARYEREMLFYACRDFQQRSLTYWQSVEEMFGDDEYALSILSDVYARFIQNVAEAKNVQRAAPGSVSAEPPVEQEISEPSTQTEPVG